MSAVNAVATAKWTRLDGECGDGDAGHLAPDGGDEGDERRNPGEVERTFSWRARFGRLDGSCAASAIVAVFMPVA